MAKKPKSLFDKFAISISAICIVHCLTVPLLVAFLPIAALGLSFDQHFHEIIFWLVFPVSSVGLIAGAREHKTFMPVIMGILGLGVFTYSIYLHGILSLSLEFILSISASLLLAYAHWMNLKLVRKYHIHGKSFDQARCDHDHHRNGCDHDHH